MEKLIETLNSLRPTVEQVEDKNTHYAFGYVDALNDAIKSVKEYNSLHGVMHNEGIKTYDLIKGDYVENIGSESKHVTKGKKYLITKVFHYHNNGWGNKPATMQNYCLTFAWILDDFGKQRRIVRSTSYLWKKV